METLEQIADKVGRETDEYLSDKIAAPEEWKRIRDIEFSIRLVEELAKQEPVAWLSEDLYGGSFCFDTEGSPATNLWSASFPVFRNPIPTPEDVRDAELYRELIYAVASKFPDETCHETALRYIRNAEKGSDATMTAAQEGK